MVSRASMCVILCIVVGSGRAYAFDAVPNGTRPTAELISEFTLATGHVQFGVDTSDWFQVVPTSDGTLTVTVREYDDINATLSLTVRDASGALLEAGVDDGLGRAADVDVIDGETIYVVVSASNGTSSYDLHVGIERPIPSVSGISDTNPDLDDIFTIYGTDLGTDADEVLVTFGGVHADTVSANGTDVDVVVPQNAVDGEVWLLANGTRVYAGDVVIGAGTPGPVDVGYDTATDPAKLVGPTGGKIYLDRVLVYFTGATSASDAASVMNSANFALSRMTGWSEAAAVPALNFYDFQIQWQPGTTYAQYAALLTQLRADPAVLYAEPRTPATASGAGLVPGLDIATSWSGVQTDFAAWDIVGMEEAWRLWSMTGRAVTPTAVRIAVLDTGFDPGSSAQLDPARYRCFQQNNAGDPFLQEVDDLLYRDTLFGPKRYHGSTVSAVLGASNDGSPRWDDGVDGGATAEGVVGVLGGLHQSGVDDDGNGNVDENGEGVEYTIDVWGLATAPGFPVATGNDYSWPAMHAALLQLASDPPDIVSISLSNGMNGYIGLPGGAVDAFAAFGERTLFVIAAPNAISTGPRPVDDTNRYVPALRAANVPYVVVSGSDPTPGVLADTNHAVSDLPGSHPALAAPYKVWTMSAPPATGGHSEQGTSYAAPLVSGAVAMLRMATGLSLRGAVERLIQSSIDITGWWDATTSMRRMDVPAALATALGEEGSLDRRTWVYVVDSDAGAGQLVAALYDPVTHTFDNASVEAFDLSYLDCQPTDVRVDALGDRVYVLCTGTAAEVLAFVHDPLGELLHIGTYGLPAPTSVVIGGGMVTTPGGYLVVPSDTGSDAEAIVLDLWDGAIVSDGAALLASSVTYLFGTATDRSGRYVATVAWNGGLSEGTTVSQVAIAELRGWDRASSPGILSVATSAFDTTATPVDPYDVTWHASADAALATFYRPESGTEWSVVGPTGVNLASEALDYFLQPISVSANPSGADDYLYAASGSSSHPHVGLFDGANVLSSPAVGAQALYGLAGASTGRFAEFADTGQFVLLGWSCSCSRQVWALPHDNTYFGPISDDERDAEMINTFPSVSAFPTNFPSPRAVAVTPALSVLSPRPGKKLTGHRRLVVLLRDVGIVKLSYAIDGVDSPSCPDDYGLLEGVSDECVLDATSWTTTETHTVDVTAQFLDGSESVWSYRY